MKVVITGAKNRDTEADRKFVHELMDNIEAKYPNTVFIVTMGMQGVGKFVRERCIDKIKDKPRHPFIECTLRLYTNVLSQTDAVNVYLARNATPYELADQLYYLASSDRKGTMEDLVGRMVNAERPCMVYLPGDTKISVL